MKPIEKDNVMHEVLNVVVQLRVNADTLEQILKKLKEEDEL